MKNKIYIITGGAGFIGSSLSKRFLERGDTVYILDNLSTGCRGNIPEGVLFYDIDISNSDALFALDIPDKVDCVYHLAAQSSGEASFENPSKDIDINYKGTYNVLELTKLKRCKRFIFSSSMSVYGDTPIENSFISEDYTCNPISYYGCNKLASEKLIKVFTRASDIKFTIFRLFSVYGPGQNMMNMKQGMVSIYLAYLLNNTPIHIKGSLERFRDFIYIDDVIDAFILNESCKKSYGEVFNLGTSIKTTVRELVELILKIYKKNNFDKWVIVKGDTSGDITGCVADIDRLKRAMGWKPRYGLDYGVAKMKEWAENSERFFL